MDQPAGEGPNLPEWFYIHRMWAELKLIETTSWMVVPGREEAKAPKRDATNDPATLSRHVGRLPGERVLTLSSSMMSRLRAAGGDRTGKLQPEAPPPCLRGCWAAAGKVPLQGNRPVSLRNTNKVGFAPPTFVVKTGQVPTGSGGWPNGAAQS